MNLGAIENNTIIQNFEGEGKLAEALHREIKKTERDREERKGKESFRKSQKIK